MAYRVKVAEVTLPKSLGTVVDRSGNEFHEHESRTYFEGDVVATEDVSPVVRDLYEAGDAHVTSQIEEVDDSAVEEHEQFLEEQLEQAAANAPADGDVGTDTTFGGEQPPFVDYDRLSANQVVERLEKLGYSAPQVAAVQRYERDHKGRATVLEFQVAEVDSSPTPEPEEDPKPRRQAKKAAPADDSQGSEE